MGIYRSTNPTDWAAVDGIIIDETAPPPSVVGVPANTAILIGQFERGPCNIPTAVPSVGNLYQTFGNNLNYSGLVALQNKKFSNLLVVRVLAASGGAKGTHTFNHSATATIVFTSLWYGVYANSITVTVEAGTAQGSKYTVHDGNTNAVFPDEVYDNVLVTMTAAQLAAIFGASNLIGVPTISSSANEPDTAAATALSSGSDGSVANTDYQTAILAQQTEALGNIVFLDAYNSTRVGYLKTSMAATTDRMALICGAAGDSVSTAVAAVASDRDTDGRLIYAFPYVYTTIAGVSTKVNPCSFYASLLSQLSPHIDPAWAKNTQYLSGIDSLELSLQRSDYVSLMAAGISAFENDSDIGMKVKSGVVTQISDSSKIMIFRRRMADWLTYSVAKFLKNYQDGVNSKENRDNAVGGIVQFVRNTTLAGMLPKDSEIKTGFASVVNGSILNTDGLIGQGYFKILYKQRIYSSMRFIVLVAQIGTTVVVTEQDQAA